MIPIVTFRDPSGAVARVPVGGILGRMPGAALSLAAPTVSEAHAMVSLRSGRLLLLGLRGALELDGQRVAEVVLRPGQRIGLGAEVVLEVVHVHVPAQVLALAGLEAEPVVLEPGPWSILPGPTLAQGLHAGALLVLSPTGERWTVMRDGVVATLSPGDAWTVEGRILQAVAVPLLQASRRRTIGTETPVPIPLTVQVWREVTLITTADGRRLDLVGHPARILRELVLNGEPGRWEDLAQSIWEDKEVNLRDSWRRQLQVLRRKLRAAGIRADLVQSLGDGRAMLDLREGDVLEDRTFAEGAGPG